MVKEVIFIIVGVIDANISRKEKTKLKTRRDKKLKKREKTQTNQTR